MSGGGPSFMLDPELAMAHTPELVDCAPSHAFACSCGVMGYAPTRDELGELWLMHMGRVLVGDPLPVDNEPGGSDA